MQTPAKDTLQPFAGTRGQVFRTLREAIHHTATQNGPMKNIASELDWSPTELSLRTTLGDENARPFPLDDTRERVLLLQRLTGDYSVLLTMADRLGFEVHPKRDHLPEILQAIQQTQQELGRKIQQLELTVPLAATAGKKERR